MIELLLLQSPIDNGNIAEVYLNNALKEFCETTRMVKKTSMFIITMEGLDQTVKIDGLLAIRDIFDEKGVKLDSTAMPSYLQAGNGYWYVKESGGEYPLIEIGYWNGTDKQAFDVDREFYIEYDASVEFVHTKSGGEKDYSKPPPVGERWHDVILARACEKANFSNPNLRRYYYAIWNDGMKRAKAAAREMSTNSSYNMKVFEL